LAFIWSSWLRPGPAMFQATQPSAGSAMARRAPVRPSASCPTTSWVAASAWPAARRERPVRPRPAPTIPRERRLWASFLAFIWSSWLRPGPAMFQATQPSAGSAMARRAPVRPSASCPTTSWVAASAWPAARSDSPAAPSPAPSAPGDGRRPCVALAAPAASPAPRARARAAPRIPAPAPNLRIALAPPRPLIGSLPPDNPQSSNPPPPLSGRGAGGASARLSF